MRSEEGVSVRPLSGMRFENDGSSVDAADDVCQW